MTVADVSGATAGVTARATSSRRRLRKMRSHGNSPVSLFLGVWRKLHVSMRLKLPDLDDGKLAIQTSAICL